MWDIAEDFSMSVGTFYNLRKEINSNIGSYSKEAIIEVTELVRKEVGKGVIEEKNAKFLLFDLQPPEEIMTLYVLFDGDKKKTDERYKSRIFHIHDGKILWVEPA